MDNTCTDCNELIPYCRCGLFVMTLAEQVLDAHRAVARWSESKFLMVQLEGEDLRKPIDHPVSPR